MEIRKLELRKSGVDLTSLAIALILLGIVVSIGAYIITGVRDAQLTSLDTKLIANESCAITDETGCQLTYSWVQDGSITVINSSNPFVHAGTGNFTKKIDSYGYLHLYNKTENNGDTTEWNVSYTYYNTSRADFYSANQAVVGLAEYGNWFKIIVVVGIAGLILALHFFSFGGGGRGRDSGIGGSY